MITTFDEYSIAAARTISEPTAVSQMTMLDAAALGLSGESGEFADHVKKILYHGQALTPERRTKMIKELGDIQWYVNLACKALEIPLTLVADGNIEKLSERHPDGNFSPAYHGKHGESVMHPCKNPNCNHSIFDHSVENGDQECNVTGCSCSNYIDS